MAVLEIGIYSRTATVTELDYTEDCVIVDDGENLWAFSGAEDWLVGEKVILTMSDNGTWQDTDDEIIAVTYLEGVE